MNQSPRWMFPWERKYCSCCKNCKANSSSHTFHLPQPAGGRSVGQSHRRHACWKTRRTRPGNPDLAATYSTLHARSPRRRTGTTHPRRGVILSPQLLRSNSQKQVPAILWWRSPRCRPTPWQFLRQHPNPCPAQISPFGRIIGMFFSPKPTFEDIVRKPNWILPTILILVMGFASVIALNLHFDWKRLRGAADGKKSAHRVINRRSKATAN